MFYQVSLIGTLSLVLLVFDLQVAQTILVFWHVLLVAALVADDAHSYVTLLVLHEFACTYHRT